MDKMQQDGSISFYTFIQKNWIQKICDNLKKKSCDISWTFNKFWITNCETKYEILRNNNNKRIMVILWFCSIIYLSFGINILYSNIY